MKPARPFKLIVRNVVVFHHAYIGLGILGMGLMSSIPLLVVGSLVLLDDIVEHTITEDTPLRILFDNHISKHLPR